MGAARSGSHQAPAITATSFSAGRNPAGNVEVAITWQIENRASEPVYVVQTQPLEIQPGAPVILDHSSNGGVWQGRPNVIPGFTILMISGGDSALYRMTYRLAVAPNRLEIGVIGRFGYSFTAPAPDWQQSKNWKQVAAWQTVVDTPPVTMPIR